MKGALTRRELEILRLVATGASTKTAADTLHVSPATVRNHIQNILAKLGAHSRLEAVALATRQQRDVSRENERQGGVVDDRDRHQHR